YRPNAVDDAAGVAELDVADFELGLRHAGVVLCSKEGERNGARAAEPFELRGGGVQFAARYESGADGTRTRFFAGVQVAGRRCGKEGRGERGYGILHAGPGTIFERERGAGEIGTARFERKAGLRQFLLDGRNERGLPEVEPDG